MPTTTEIWRRSWIGLANCQHFRFHPVTLRIPRDSATSSRPIQPVIPALFGHRFHGDSAGAVGAKRRRVGIVTRRRPPRSNVYGPREELRPTNRLRRTQQGTIVPRSRGYNTLNMAIRAMDTATTERATETTLKATAY